jgi:creatinase
MSEFNQNVFTVAEMERRLEGLYGIMDRLGLDAVITTSIHNTLYYAGFYMAPFGRLHAAVIPRRGTPGVIGPLIEYDRPRNNTWFEDARIYNDHADAVSGALKHIEGILADNGITRGRLGIEEDTVSIALMGRLKAAFPAFEFTDIAEATMRRRLVKSAEEIQVIRDGAQVSDIGGRACIDACREGAPEYVIARTAVAAMEDEIVRRYPGIEVDATWCWFQSGPARSYGAHNLNTPRKVGAGELLSLNCFPMIAGYYTALERSLVLGHLPNEIRKPFEVNVAAHKAGIDAVRAGVRCSDIDKVIDPIYEEAGYLENRTFGTGHSFGILGFWYGREEGGELRPYNATVLRENMVVSIEPMITVEGIGGFRHHDILLVQEGGNEVLNDFERGVIVI